MMKSGSSGVSVRIGDVEIEAIEKIDVRVGTMRGGIVGAAIKKPIAVIIRTPGGEWRVDLAEAAGDRR